MNLAYVIALATGLAVVSPEWTLAQNPTGTTLAPSGGGGGGGGTGAGNGGVGRDDEFFSEMKNRLQASDRTYWDSVEMVLMSATRKAADKWNQNDPSGAEHVLVGAFRLVGTENRRMGAHGMSIRLAQLALETYEALSQIRSEPNSRDEKALQKYRVDYLVETAGLICQTVNFLDVQYRYPYWSYEANDRNEHFGTNFLRQMDWRALSVLARYLDFTAKKFTALREHDGRLYVVALSSNPFVYLNIAEHAARALANELASNFFGPELDFRECRSRTPRQALEELANTLSAINTTSVFGSYEGPGFDHPSQVVAWARSVSDWVVAQFLGIIPERHRLPWDHSINPVDYRYSGCDRTSDCTYRRDPFNQSDVRR